MATRKAHARWEGSVTDGKGQVASKRELNEYELPNAPLPKSDGKGTNPEELLGAAHASCFAMAMSLVWGRCRIQTGYIDATAHVTILPQDGTFRITKSHLVCEAAVSGIDAAAFMKHAEAAKAGCPVSVALAGTMITLDVKLVR